MARIDDNTGAGVGPYPSPVPPAPRAFSFVLAAAAAVAGFLGYCTTAAVLALLSLVFNLWDFYGGRGKPELRSSTGTQGSSTKDSTDPAIKPGPGRY